MRICLINVGTSYIDLLVDLAIGEKVDRVQHVSEKGDVTDGLAVYRASGSIFSPFRDDARGEEMIPNFPEKTRGKSCCRQQQRAFCRFHFHCCLLLLQEHVKSCGLDFPRSGFERAAASKNQ